MKKKMLLDRITSATDLSDEPLPGQTIIEVTGDQRLLIEHHKGVVCYGSQEIGIRVGYGTVYIRGFELLLQHMSSQQLLITGCIDTITLARRGKS